MTELTIDVGDISLSYQRLRTDDARIHGLVLHGLAADHRGLLPLARAWAGADVVVPDLPGFGHSAPMRGEHSLARYAETVDAFCARLGLEGVVVVGHSLGATIGLALAAHFPDRVRGIVLFSPVTTGTGPASWSTRAYYWAGAMLPPWLARAWFLSRPAIYLADRSMVRSPDPDVRRRITRADYRSAELASVRAIKEIYRSIRGTRFGTLAASVRAPAMVVGAERDGLAPPGILAALTRSMPQAELVMVRDAGHLWPVENPDAAARLLERGLARLDGPDQSPEPEPDGRQSREPGKRPSAGGTIAT